MITPRTSCYLQNRGPLAPAPYLALPPGCVQATGWIRTQLELQRDGLTGHLPDFMPEVGAGSGWLGGDGESWEKGPYYLKGLLALAFALDDPLLKEKTLPWIEWTLQSQRDDGFFGPAQDDWWPRMVMTHILREHAEASGDPRVLPFLLRYYAHLLRELPGRPLRDWGKARAGDEIETIFWAYNRSEEAWLLDLVRLLAEQAYPWTDIFTENRFLEFGPDFHPKHNVNIPQALKLPVLYSLLSKSEKDREAMKAGLAHLDRDHGMPFGINAGTEYLAGRSAMQGVETCSTVEKMLSVEVAIRILAEAALGDNLELLAYNALPASLTPDIRQHVYYTLPNNVRAITQKHGYTQDYESSTTPGAPSGYPCCLYNFHMGWPKFVQNSWAATADGGLAVLAYAPTTITALVADGASVTIREETHYPFEDSILLTVNLAGDVSFPLDLRIPSWCDDPQIHVNETVIEGIRPGTFFRLERNWRDGDRVALRFPMKVRREQGCNDSVSIHRGPLLYTLNIEEKWKRLCSCSHDFPRLEVEPLSAWNYALRLESDVASSFQVETGPVPANPFLPGSTPVRLTARARRVPEWTLSWRGEVAFDPPPSPVASNEPEESITLVPFGSRMLRVSSFPVLGTPAVPRSSFTPDYAGRGLSEWLLYGGGWYVRDQALHAASNFSAGPTAGGKALVMGSSFADFEYEAMVTVGAEGEAGLLFRASKVAIGPDDYAGYYAGLSTREGRLVLGRAAGDWTVLASAAVPVAPNESRRLRIVARAESLKVYLDGAPDPVLEVEDSTYSAGSIGVRQFFDDGAKTSARFSEIRARSL